MFLFELPLHQVHDEMELVIVDFIFESNESSSMDWFALTRRSVRRGRDEVVTLLAAGVDAGRGGDNKPETKVFLGRLFGRSSKLLPDATALGARAKSAFAVDG